MIGWFARLLGSPRFTAAAGRFAPFAGVAEEVVTGDPLVAVDRTITRWLQQHSVGAWGTAWLVLCRVLQAPGGPSLE